MMRLSCSVEGALSVQQRLGTGISEWPNWSSRGQIQLPLSLPSLLWLWRRWHSQWHTVRGIYHMPHQQTGRASFEVKEVKPSRVPWDLTGMFTPAIHVGCPGIPLQSTPFCVPHSSTTPPGCAKEGGKQRIGSKLWQKRVLVNCRAIVAQVLSLRDNVRPISAGWAASAINQDPLKHPKLDMPCRNHSTQKPHSGNINLRSRKT